MTRLKLKDYLVVAGGVLVIAASLSLVNVNPVGGAGSAPVTVVNPSSDPVRVTVQGIGTVTGTVAATQSGAWNVGITNTAAIRMANIDDPGRIPYQATIDKGNQCSSRVCAFVFGPVPQGMRLVVQHIAGALTFDSAIPAGQPAGACVFAQGGNHALSCFNYGVVGSISAEFDQLVQLYIDQGQTVLVNAGAGGISTFLANGGQTVTITGYLVNCTAAPCAPIAN
jgi:hypothetical protein